MIEAIVPALLRTLSAPAVAESSLLSGLEDEVQKLKDDLAGIEGVIEHLDMLSYVESVQVWLQTLKEVAYDASDVFDELNMEVALHPELLTESDAGVIVRAVRLVSICFLSCFTDAMNPILFRHQMGRRIRGIVAGLNEMKVSDHRLILGLTPTRGHPESSRAREIISFQVEDQQLLIGRDAEKQQLIEKLCAPDDCVPRLVSIVGMGGIGKTTLAHAVYNEDIVKEHFPLRMWVTVGEKFDARNIIRRVLSGTSAVGALRKNPSLEHLHRCLISEIKDKRFLIVLDDAWSERSEEWDQIWRPLRYGGTGSKVLMTCRSMEVAMVKGSLPFSLTLERLSEFDCWSILEKRAFVDGKPYDHPVKKEIAKEITKRLDGIPLSANLMGAAMHGNFTEEQWKRLMFNNIWYENSGEEGISPSLVVSYEALPSYLKPCFQFCSLFPKDHEFNRESLMWMWMAHDFIQPTGYGRMEDAGRIYFDELLQRSFFKYFNDSYVMHDLIHDLAEFISKRECVRAEDKSQLCGVQAIIHHLSLYCGEHSLEPKDLYQFDKARTLLDLNGSLQIASGHILCQLFSGLKCIRVLKLSGELTLELFPMCISELKHLRYLELGDTKIGRLPESLCMLYNLQTLIVDCELPKGLCKLVNLRNLVAPGHYISKIAWIGKLKCLQELRGPFKVSKKKNKGRNIEELKGMNQLRGTLRIENLEKVSSFEEAIGIQLKDKVLLHRLELNWQNNSASEYSLGSERVLEALHPPLELEEMKLENHPGSRPPSWMMQDQLSASNLVSLHLCGCRSWMCLPIGLARLPLLRILKIKGMHGVKQVGPEFLHCGSDSDTTPFPSLEELLFVDMKGLERWVGGGAAEEETVDNHALRWQQEEQCRGHSHLSQQCFCFPRLHKLVIKKCPKLATTFGLLQHHSLKALQHLVIWDCEELMQILGDGEEGGRLHSHCPTMSMLQILDIVNCPRLAWSELGALLLLNASSLMALRICRFGPSSYKVRMRV